MLLAHEQIHAKEIVSEIPKSFLFLKANFWEVIKANCNNPAKTSLHRLQIPTWDLIYIYDLQRFLQSVTKRLEEWRIKRTDTEKWMHYRQLSPQVKQSIRKYEQYKWLATKGVDEQSLIKSLPIDLQRKVKRHLCFDLVRRVSWLLRSYEHIHALIYLPHLHKSSLHFKQVPLFDQMDETTLDAICERLKLELCAKGMFLLHEGDPVNQMLFIIRGELDSYTTNDGSTGFFNSSRIGPGDFCCEELLTWALDLHSTIILPSSTCTVKAISEVEAFALTAEDLKFVAAQFKRLHSKQVKHKLRFYSHQWRTWAACFIQAAWRRHKRLKEMTEDQSESLWALCADNQAAGVMRSFKYKPQSGSDAFILSSVQKPTDPDFSVDSKWLSYESQDVHFFRNLTLVFYPFELLVRFVEMTMLVYHHIVIRTSYNMHIDLGAYIVTQS